MLTSTNGNGMPTYHAATNSWGSDIPNLGYGDDEVSTLAFFHATNATVRGLVFQANPFAVNSYAPPNPSNPAKGPISKGVNFVANSPENGGNMCQNFHVSGCWFGLDPVTKQVAYCQDPIYGLGLFVATPAICISSYRTRNAVSSSGVNYNFPGTIGVAAGSANPRAEFNVLVTGYGFDSEGHDYRFSGNFFGVLPDGVSAADMGVLSGLQQSDGFIEVGRNDNNLLIGTDGDGVNDADEGNIFGPLSAGGVCVNLYSDPRTNIVVAGNYFGVDIHGNPFPTNSFYADALVDTLGTAASFFRFGSDFNGVSDDLEANVVTNAPLFAHDQPGAPSQTSWVSMRGNSLQQTATPASSRPPIGDGLTSVDGQFIYEGFIDDSANPPLDLIPVIGAGTTTTTLAGTCGKPTAGSAFTRLIVDLYEADTSAGAQPQGKRWLASFMDNSPADADPAVGAFSFSTGLGLTSGTKITLTVTYSEDPNPTITSVSKNGSVITITVTGGVGPNPIYGIETTSCLGGCPWTYIAAAVGGSATFNNTAATAFYRATGPSATGQTSPFSDVYTIP